MAYDRVVVARGSLGMALVVMVCSCGAPGPRGAPPTKSQLAVQTVTYACVPLRAGFTVDGQLFIRGLFIEPDCPTPDLQTADCYKPPAGAPPCPFSCPQLTEWKMLGGTAPMHSFVFPLIDDGSHTGALPVTVHLTLSTLDGTLIWDGDQTEEVAPLIDNRAGTFHSDLMEFRLDSVVWQVLGSNC
jgi:hypothetical protein